MDDLDYVIRLMDDGFIEAFRVEKISPAVGINEYKVSVYLARLTGTDKSVSLEAACKLAVRNLQENMRRHS